MHELRRLQRHLFGLGKGAGEVEKTVRHGFFVQHLHPHARGAQLVGIGCSLETQRVEPAGQDICRGQSRQVFGEKRTQARVVGIRARHVMLVDEPEGQCADAQHVLHAGTVGLVLDELQERVEQDLRRERPAVLLHQIGRERAARAVAADGEATGVDAPALALARQ